MTGEKFCQSCAMPLTVEAHFGTNADGTKNEEYCIYCYKDGAFTSEMTMEEMIESVSPRAAGRGLSEKTRPGRQCVNTSPN